MFRLFIFAGVAGLLLTQPASARVTDNQDELILLAEQRTWESFEEKVETAKSSMMGDPKASLEAAQDAASLVEPLPSSTERSVGLATAFWLQAEAMTRMNRAESALPLIEKALPLAAENGDQDKLDADLLLALGRVTKALGDLQVALTSFQEAHEIYATLGEARSQAIALQNIGSIYNDARDYPRVLEYYDRAVETFSGDPALDLSAHNNRANALKELGRYDEAVNHFQQALEIGQAYESPLLDARILTNIASAQFLADDLDEAEATAERAQTRVMDPAASAWEPFVWGVKAQIAYARGELQEASRFIARAFDGQDITATNPTFRDFHEVAYKIWSDLGQPQRALRHHMAFKRLDDQGRNLAASANAALAAAQFDFASQQLEIEQLKSAQLAQDVRLARSQSRQRTIILFAVLAIGAIVLASITFAYLSTRRSRNQARDANRKLRVTNQALEKANQAKANFLAATSHEIRTPLNGILGMTEVMLMEDTLDKGNRKRVETVRSAGETMLALVDDILDLSKIRSGRLTLASEPVAFQHVIQQIGDLWEAPAKAKGLEFTVDAEDCPEKILSDEKRIRQIVFNLVSNAVKFTESGSVRLKAESQQHPNGERIVLTVSDTGVGIPEDKTEDIFKSFHQIESGANRKFGGTGLGLAITRNVVRALGGEIMVESEPGKGSVFTVMLPLQHVAQSEAVLEEPFRDTPQDVSQLDILIAEDNQVNRAVLEAMLSSNVRSIEFAEDGQKALEAMERRDFDVILMDKQMPNMDGMAATRAIREMKGSARDIYIIAVTADAFDEARDQILACGMDDFIAKPVAMETLLSSLRKGVELGLSHAAASAEKPDEIREAS